MTRTKALAKLYKAIVGSDTRKNTIADILIDLANNWSGGSGGGGGGEVSDFSTATLTFDNDGVPSGRIVVSIAEDDEGVSSSSPFVYTSGTYEVVLYKGNAYGSVYADTGEVTYSGDVTYDPDNGEAIITGDCTITISADGGGVV